MSVTPLNSPLEFERMRVQHLLPTAPPPPVLPSTSSGFDSTIAPVEMTDKPTPQFKPRLEHPALASIRVYEKGESSAARQAKLFDTQIKKDLSTIDQLNDDKELAIRDFLEKEKSRKNWGMITTIIQYLASASSIFLGIACIASGNVAPGALLCISGATTIGDAMARDLRLYDSVAAWLTKSVEVQAKIVKTIEIGAFTLSLASGFAGGFWAYNAGALGNVAETFSTKVTQGFQVATSLMGSAARIKEGHLQKKISELQSQMKFLELDLDSHYQNIDENSLAGKKMMENLNNMARDIKRTIQICSTAAHTA